MARHAQLLDSERSAVSDLFGGQRRFQMPLYQRQYVWDKEQLSDLWDDIDALLDGQAEVRFLGALVLKQIESDTGRKSSL